MSGPAKIDLHSHSTFSDGALDPEAVVDAARAAGVDVFALTDHDTVAGLPRACARGEEIGVRVVPGIELNCGVEDLDVHILGYGLDPEDPVLRKRLADLVQARHDRVAKICELLGAQGIELSPEDLYRRTGGKRPRRKQIAEALVAAGHVASVRQAFRRYLSHRGSAYVPAGELTPSDAVRMLADAGGVAVVAHPGLIGDDELLPSLVAAGVRGLEVYHKYPDPALVERYAKLAERYRLIPTGGSDSHGGPDGPTHAPPGTFLCPPESFERLEAEWLTRRKIAR